MIIVMVTRDVAERIEDFRLEPKRLVLGGVDLGSFIVNRVVRYNNGDTGVRLVAADGD